MKDEIKEIERILATSGKYITYAERNYVLDCITNLQKELKEYKMLFDAFSERPYAHRYLEEKKKELGNDKIIGLDSEMIYKDYYELQKENKIQKEKIEHLLIDLRGESEYKQRIDKAIEYIEKYCEDYVIEDSPDEMCLFYKENGNYKPEAKEELLNILNGDDE